MHHQGQHNHDLRSQMQFRGTSCRPGSRQQRRPPLGSSNRGRKFSWKFLTSVLKVGLLVGVAAMSLLTIRTAFFQGRHETVRSELLLRAVRKRDDEIRSQPVSITASNSGGSGAVVATSLTDVPELLPNWRRNRRDGQKEGPDWRKRRREELQEIVVSGSRKMKKRHGVASQWPPPQPSLPSLPPLPPLPPPLSLDPSLDLTTKYQTCDDWLKEYKIAPDEDWGTAPKEIQRRWQQMRCDRVLGEGTFTLDDLPTGGRERAVVVVWSSIKGWLEYLRPPFVKAAREECPTECVWTDDREKLNKADGVLFQASTHKKKEFPHWETGKPEGLQYVFVNLEPVTFRQITPLLKDEQYMSKFDLTMTYERGSDIPLGYVADAPAARYFSAEKLSFKEKDGFGSPDAVVAFVSNCKVSGATKRTQYMSELMKHGTVHSIGKCLHNRDEPILVEGEGTSIRQQNKIEVLRRYKFYLAFENNNRLRDYVTEKVYNGLQAGTLPVYWGAANIDEYVPRGSVVQARDFESPRALAEYLMELSRDEEAYEEYFRWRGNSTEAERFQKDVVSRSAYGVNAMCRLCERLVRDREASTGVREV